MSASLEKSLGAIVTALERLRRPAARFLSVALVTLATPARADAPTSSTASFEDAPSATASKPSPERRFELPPPHRFRLENGLSFLVQRDARQPLFAFVVSYEVGHRDDPPGYEGLAHLVEHLSFRGSRHLGPWQGDHELAKVGAMQKNGATGPDNSMYYALLPAQYLPLALWVESERMGFTLERFNDESLALELATVRKEMLLRKTDEVEFALMSRLFPEGHPYHLTEQRDARGAELSDVQWLFQAGYRPDKARIVIVGDVDPALVESLGRRYFGPIPNPPISLERKPIRPRVFPGRERLTINRYVGERRLIMVWPAPLEGGPDEPAFRVALTIARAGRSSIGAALEKARLAEGAKIQLVRRDSAAFLVVEPVLGRQSQYEDTEYAVERYMFDLARLPPSSKVLDKARALVKRDILRATEDPMDHAMLHLDALRQGGRPFDLGATLARLDAVTPAAVTAIAKKYFSPYHRFSTWYGDLRFEPSVPTGDYIQYEVFK